MTEKMSRGPLLTFMMRIHEKDPSGGHNHLDSLSITPSWICPFLYFLGFKSVCPRGAESHEEDVEDSQPLTHEEQTQRLAALASWAM